MKTEPKAKIASALPLETVREELTFLQNAFRELMEAYRAKIEADLTKVQGAVEADFNSRRKLPASRGADLRDILMLIRSLEVKPAKGRRRDLKKVENVIEELHAIIERWK